MTSSSVPGGVAPTGDAAGRHAAYGRPAALLRRALSHPPHLLAHALFSRSVRSLRDASARRHDARHTTYAVASPAALPYARLTGLAVSEREAQAAPALSRLYRDHRFDLLGSGWARVHYGRSCRGLHGHRYAPGAAPAIDADGTWLCGRINDANLEHSREVWRLVDSDYTPIDWQLDFKSGHRWSEATWYRDVPIVPLPGADVKVPWELSRMQHLPQLAVAFGVTRDAGHAREIRNQILDWIATNPPRFGVNWSCTMDVGIRVANWLVAYDLLRAWNAPLDHAFQQALARSVYDHALHISRNLERDGLFRGNHYLANVTGLLFAASYLPRSAETDGWVAFSVRELMREVRLQFGPDGANFEASTCYHRLSAEMVTWATALMAALRHEGAPSLQATGPDVMPPWYLERVEKMAEFTAHVTKPNGRVAQIGDNDSGRFLKLAPVMERLTVLEARSRYEHLDGYTESPDGGCYWMEDHLDHRHLPEAASGLFDRPDLTAVSGAAGDIGLDRLCVQRLAGGRKLPSYLAADARSTAERITIGSPQVWHEERRKLLMLPPQQRRESTLSFPGPDLREGLRTFAYPDFGLYIFRSRRAFLAIRCGSVGQNGVGGHAHNDQLSLELQVDGEDRLCDPGTYVYTPLPDLRNRYRSVAAHAAPSWPGEEPGDLSLGLFRLRPKAESRCIWFDARGFAGSLIARRRALYRAIRIDAECIVIEDFSTGSPLSSPAWPNEGGRPPYSPGYGMRIREARALRHADGNHV